MCWCHSLDHVCLADEARLNQLMEPLQSIFVSNASITQRGFGCEQVSMHDEALAVIGGWDPLTVEEPTLLPSHSGSGRSSLQPPRRSFGTGGCLSDVEQTIARTAQRNRPLVQPAECIPQ
jgi:hypothetical protein